MGTRCVTKFFNEGSDKPFAIMYRQFDGYPEGHGTELAQFLANLRLVNGLGLGNNSGVANGMGCLAAQVVKNFKEEPGGIYLMDDQDHGEDFTYEVYSDSGLIRMRCKDYKKNVIFDGDPLMFGGEGDEGDE